MFTFKTIENHWIFNISSLHYLKDEHSVFGPRGRKCFFKKFEYIQFIKKYEKDPNRTN
jgi:hypothetical protein